MVKDTKLTKKDQSYKSGQTIIEALIIVMITNDLKLAELLLNLSSLVYGSNCLLFHGSVLKWLKIEAVVLALI